MPTAVRATAMRPTASGVTVWRRARRADHRPAAWAARSAVPETANATPPSAPVTRYRGRPEYGSRRNLSAKAVWRHPGVPAMIRHRPRTRGVAAQHASLSRWRSPVRIRSGPPSLTASSYAPSARPDGAFFVPAPDPGVSGRLRPVTVRDPQYTPRTPPDGGRRRPSWLAPALVVALVVGIGIGFGGGIVGAISGSPSATGSPSPTSVAAATPVSPNPTPETTADPGATASATPGPTPSATPGTSIEDVAIVPVTNFRSGRSSVKAADIRAIAGGDGTYSSLVLVKQDADAILAALDLTREDLGDSLDIVSSAAKLKAWLPKHRTALAFLRADDVDESVRSLAWGGTALFGVDRIKSLDAWPLVAQLAVADGTTHYDPMTAWTMVAGGDILLDRGVALAIKASGVNFPFNGGTVDITGTCKDCSPFGWD